MLIGLEILHPKDHSFNLLGLWLMLMLKKISFSMPLRKLGTRKGRRNLIRRKNKGSGRRIAEIGKLSLTSLNSENSKTTKKTKIKRECLLKRSKVLKLKSLKRRRNR